MYRFIIVAFIASARAQLSLQGTCDVAVTPLNITQLQGEWFQIARIENSLETGQCPTVTISPVMINGILVSAVVETRQVVNKAIVSINATITMGTGGQLIFTYDDLTFNAAILSTDYTGYALLYGCNAQNTTQKNVWAWQLGRANQYTMAQRAAVNTAVTQNPDLVGAQWVTLGFTTEQCDTSGAAALAAPVLLLALYNIFTKIL